MPTKININRGFVLKRQLVSIKLSIREYIGSRCRDAPSTVLSLSIVCSSQLDILYLSKALMLHCHASLLPINSQNFRCEYNLWLLTTVIRIGNNLRLSTTFIIYDNSHRLIITESSHEAEYIVIVFDAYAFGRCSNLLALQANCQKPVL